MTDQVPTEVRLPSGGLMPMVGFGTWRVSGASGYTAVRTALDAGYRHIDTATMYRNEAEVGRAVADSGIPREQIFITTKLPEGNAGLERRTLAASLRDLGTEYVDLWLVHWPPGGAARPEVWRELLAARERGEARAVGVSNYDIGQLDELIAATGVAPEVNQVPWSPARHDPRVLAAHRERGVVVEGYSPFKGGDLGHPTLVEIAGAHGVSTAQVVLRWHLQHGIVVIPKSVTPERMRANLDVHGFALDAGQVARVDALAGDPTRGSGA